MSSTWTALLPSLPPAYPNKLHHHKALSFKTARKTKAETINTMVEETHVAPYGIDQQAVNRCVRKGLRTGWLTE